MSENNAINPADLREDYQQGTLSRADLDPDPLTQLSSWLSAAVEAKISDPNAMTLATIGLDGMPTARTVLLKGQDERGLVFYTNFTSRKGRELTEHPKAAVLFYWRELERQIQIRGAVSKIAREESEAYFFSRPYSSRLGAWASRQSETVADREALEARFEKYRKRFPDNGESDCVPLPDFWGGFRIAPQLFEFWQGQSGRMHDRFIYTPADRGWKIERHSP
ncbi:MAG: pyridoxamine 5'-phosphate oxidase [Verrucomicrobiota bacterium]